MRVNPYNLLQPSPCLTYVFFFSGQSSPAPTVFAPKTVPHSPRPQKVPSPPPLHPLSHRHVAANPNVASNVFPTPSVALDVDSSGVFYCQVVSFLLFLWVFVRRELGPIPVDTSSCRKDSETKQKDGTKV